ncbi:23004_t:CDS:2, partial [Gigaspora margarita]
KKIAEPLATNYIEKAPEIEYVESIDDKSKSLEIMCRRHCTSCVELLSDGAGSVNDEPEISPDLPASDEPKPSNGEFNTQSKTYPSGYLTRKQREAQLRQ